jgi:cyclase
MVDAMKIAALLLTFALPVVMYAQEWKDDTARMEKVADGIYAIVHENATDAWPHSNTGVVVGDDSVLVVDSTYLPSRAKADIALIRKVTDKPVKYLVMTHWHFDHNNGNSVYRDEFPGISIVSERRTRDYIDLNSTWWPKFSTAADSDRRASLTKLEKQLAENKNEEGKELTAQERKDLQKAIPQRKAELEELAKLEMVAPNLVFDRALTLHVGKRRVELRDMGRANSPNDVTIYVPDQKVLFTGDIVVQSPLPFFGASWPVSWVDVLKEIEATPIAAIVPGHGPVMRDHSYVTRLRELMQDVNAHVEALLRQGKTLAQIQAAVDLSKYRTGFAPWENEPATDWKAITDVLVERAFRGVRGQG